MFILLLTLDIFRARLSSRRNQGRFRFAVLRLGRENQSVNFSGRTLEHSEPEHDPIRRDDLSDRCSLGGLVFPFRVDHGESCMGRDYLPIVAEVQRQIVAQDNLERRMRVVVDCLWSRLHEQEVSWVGFYLKASDREEMVLGPHRDKPACSPIGLHGACGRAFLDRKPLIVRDVKELGDSYIACDPRDQSEVVIPIYHNRSAEPYGVLDLDSFELGAFDQSDVEGLNRVLIAAGLQAQSAPSQDGLPWSNALESLWKTTVGDPRVCVAVLDGPVDRSHPSLAHAKLTCLDTLVPCAANEGASSQHGTHIASVIFAQHGKGALRGVAPGCRGLVVPIFEDTPSNSIRACSQIDLARAIVQTVQNGANIINISAGQLDPSGEAHPLLVKAVRYCADQRVLIVSAVGNDGCECLHVPGALPSVLAVGAMNAKGEPLGFSNWGGRYQSQGVLVLGEDIPGARPGGGIARRSGTSFATALVSGVAALLLSLQLKRGGGRADPLIVRDALIDSAIGCEDQPVSDCRRLLAGRLNLVGAVSTIKKGALIMPDEYVTPKDLPSATGGNGEGGDFADTLTAATPAVHPSAVADVVSEMGNGDLSAPEPTPPVVQSVIPADRADPPRVEAPAPFAHVTPSECTSCGGGDGAAQAPQLAYALGELGYDFGTEARRDSFLQRDVTNPHDPTQLLAHLEHDPWDAASVIWTLNQDATPIYAIYPAGPFAQRTYERLCQALGEQLREGVERISVPGFVGGKVRLLNGQTVPVIIPELRGLYSWSTPALIKAVGADADENRAEAVRNFLYRVYYELRNLGVTPQERAMNYAATNAFQVHRVFELCGKEQLELDTIEVHRSPICRPESDCWDVKLTFFDPTKRFERARHVHRFTVDVSDVIPVTVGEVRHWNVY